MVEPSTLIARMSAHIIDAFRRHIGVGVCILMMLFVNDIGELLQFLRELSSRFGRDFDRISICAITRSNVYRFLVDPQLNVTVL